MVSIEPRRYGSTTATTAMLCSCSLSRPQVSAVYTDYNKNVLDIKLWSILVAVLLIVIGVFPRIQLAKLRNPACPLAPCLNVSHMVSYTSLNGAANSPCRGTLHEISVNVI